MKGVAKLLTLLLVLATTACSPSQILNPYYETPSKVALGGQANDHALAGDSDNTDSARAALEAMASYRRAHAPQPNNPVIQPAVVRVMWVPDHLNSHGDLVPAHYYYLKVLKDRFAVQDAFELESQLGSKKSSGAVPFVYGGTK